MFTALFTTTGLIMFVVMLWSSTLAAASKRLFVMVFTGLVLDVLLGVIAVVSFATR